MLSSSVRNLLGRWSPRPLAALVTTLPETVAEPLDPAAVKRADAGVRTPWPAARLNLANQLWGPGFIFPGGEPETLRLTRPLGLSSAASLLLIGVGSGGPATVVTLNQGAYVTGMDCDASLLAAARGLVTRSQLKKKVTIEAWDPGKPEFASNSHHHCLALEPFHGAQPEPILVGLTRALRPGGQIMLTALAAVSPLDMSDPTVRRWAELEQRNPVDLLPPVAVTRMMGRVGLEVRVAEDISQRHVDSALLGWRVMLNELCDFKPTRQQAVQIVAEAELWLLRRRLIRGGRLRMMRWHAIKRAPII